MGYLFGVLEGFFFEGAWSPAMAAETNAPDLERKVMATLQRMHRTGEGLPPVFMAPERPEPNDPWAPGLAAKVSGVLWEMKKKGELSKYDTELCAK